MQETSVQSLGGEDPLEEETATHSSILAWKIPWIKEPGRLQSMGHTESNITEHATFDITSSLSQCFSFKISIEKNWKKKSIDKYWFRFYFIFSSFLYIIECACLFRPHKYFGCFVLCGRLVSTGTGEISNYEIRVLL